MKQIRVLAYYTKWLSEDVLVLLLREWKFLVKYSGVCAIIIVFRVQVS